MVRRLGEIGGRGRLPAHLYTSLIPTQPIPNGILVPGGASLWPSQQPKGNKMVEVKSTAKVARRRGMDVEHALALFVSLIVLSGIVASVMTSGL
jgi:hypothetical protein